MIGLGNKKVAVAVASDIVGHRNAQGFQPSLREYVSKSHHAVAVKLVREPDAEMSPTLIISSFIACRPLRLP